MAKPKRTQYAPMGLGQLTLVEHALCPLDPSASLKDGMIFETGYSYTDREKRFKAKAKIHGPAGLSASDEFYLWGLLALTLAQDHAEGELHATPHYCLRSFGLVDQHAKRGGRQYRQFAEALERLSLVHYRCDAFYDPVRAEHRKVSFGFLSYSLPLDEKSSRAWRIVWDPLFLDLVRPLGGHFRFDLGTYQELDPASRRLFLFVSKVFQRRRTTPSFQLSDLGVNVLGFSETLAPRHLKQKVARSVAKLAERGIVETADAGLVFEAVRRGEYRLQLTRGPYFTRPLRSKKQSPHEDSPLTEPLLVIGVDTGAIPRILKTFPSRLVREWVDITLAAKERFGETFFTKSPAAYLMSNLKHAVKGERTPPDWWHDIRKAEMKRQAALDRKHRRSRVESDDVSESQKQFLEIANQLFGEYQAAGQPRELARKNSERLAREYLRKKPDPQSLTRVIPDLKILKPS